jgi:hypothetical protein
MKRSLFFLFLLTISTTSVYSAPPIITCPADPPVIRRLQLQERWRIDVDNPETPVLGFTFEPQVITHDDRFYLLDGQLCFIHIFGENGEYLGQILGEGEGPGDVRNPGQMFLCDDGRLAVQHGYPTKLEFVDLEGNPLGRWRLQSNAYANKLLETPQGWLAMYTDSKMTDGAGTLQLETFVALHDAEGGRTQELYKAVQKHEHHEGMSSDEEEEYLPWYTVVYAGDNQLVCSAERNHYRLEWRNLNGELTRVATREFQAHRRSEDELNVLKYSNYSIRNNDLVFPDRKLSAFDPMIQSLDVLADGSLRVRTSFFQKEMPAGMVCRFEIHEPTGELRERVELYDPTGAFDVDYDAIALLNDSCVMVLRNVQSAARAAYDMRLHPKVQEKLPPIPDEREDVVFTPIVFDLVPYAGDGEPGF